MVNTIKLLVLSFMIFAFHACMAEQGRALEGWWRFLEVSGDVTADFSGNTRDAFVVTNVVEHIVSAPGGGALWFNCVSNIGESVGAAASFVEVPEFSEVPLSNGFTVAAWIYVEMAAPFSTLMIRTSNLSDWTDGFGLYIGEMGGIGGFMRSGEDSNAVEGGSIGTNIWTHVAMTYLGRNLQIYVDGKVVASKEFPLPKSANAASPFVIGPLSDSEGARSFSGAIGDVRIWSTALNASQIGDVRSQFLGESMDPNEDDDGDGMPNGWEVRYGLDPRDASDAQSDMDGDGMSNLQECRLGRNPCVKAFRALPSLLKTCTVVTP